MKFGLFVAPFHKMGENPTLCYERDLETVEWAERLGFDEVFVGEHHSAGWEIIPSPELFIANAAARTKRIRLGTGVVSIPYHHPLNVAARIAFLDHLTRGRIIFGVGPGLLPGDAYMRGIEPTEQRPRMIEGVKAIIRLFTEDKVTLDGSWFKLVDAHLQVKPFQRPYPPMVTASTFTPSGFMAAGQLGTGIMTFFTGGLTDLNARWKLAEEVAANNGRKLSRHEWRMVLPIHLAESRPEAMRQIRDWGNEYFREYAISTTGLAQKDSPDQPLSEVTIDGLVNAGAMLIGTPDDAIAKIREMNEAAGGIGGVLNMLMDWGTREQQLRSHELMARYVMPVFQGSADSIVYSNQWSRERRDVLTEKAAVGVAAAFAAAGQSAQEVGAGERVATHPASATKAANGGKAAK
ncbi:MAG TPA: LLM class flavin-dependent oxidoreductase [Candidatus Binataceae bacterium]|jgi:limonene 1,2-monooxygenase|nr:LLM class flavin-dependent oxidoreductase [Candidatus Binataceae bacterium]